MDLVDEVRTACAWVAARARHVRIDEGRLGPYAEALPAPSPGGPPAELALPGAPAEARAAFAITLDAINFGSGWWPTIRKRPGRSGFFTVALGLHERFRSRGPLTSAELRRIDATAVAAMLGQDSGHELMALFAAALRDVGERVEADHGGRFLDVVEAAAGSAVAMAGLLARWPAFHDVSLYAGRPVPLFKRAQITAADVAAAGVARFGDLDRLTLFADNLVPHVLRLDRVLVFEPALARRIEAGELIEHGSPEEVEIRACAVHAVERMTAARPDLSAAAIDGLLWSRGGGARYKARPRHRSRCTAY